MKIIWQPEARQRLRAEFDYIRRERPLAARRWLERINKAVSHLARFPFSGRSVPEIQRADVREVIVDGYRVIYRPEPDGIHVVAMRHSREVLQLGHLDPETP